MSPRSVCFLTNRLARAGAELQVALLARGLAKRGWRTAVISIAEPVATIEGLAEAGVPVHSLGLHRGRAAPLALSRLCGVLRREAPDVLHAHLFHASLAARLTRPVHRAPVLICSAHSVREGPAWRYRAYRATDFLGDRLTAVSEAVAIRQRETRATRPARQCVIPNGVDLRAHAPDAVVREAVRAELGAESRFVWVSAARFTRAKNHANLLRAFAALDSEESLLVLAGAGPLEEATRALCVELGLRERVRFLGERDDVARLHAAADACALASDWEGLPVGLLEAAAAERPIVATRVGGNAEIVEAGASGTLVPPGEPAALAAAMRHVMSLSAEARAEMGRRGRARVAARFGIDAVLDRWEALYREVAGAPRS